MKKKKSKYTAVLTYRESLMNQKRKDYLEAKSKVDECFQQIEIKKESIVKLREDNERISRSTNCDSVQLVQNSEYIDSLGYKIETLKNKVRELIRESDQLHQIFVEQQKEFKIIEKLIEKENQVFKIEYKKKEQKTMEDLQIIRSQRKVV